MSMRSAKSPVPAAPAPTGARAYDRPARSNGKIAFKTMVFSGFLCGEGSRELKSVLRRDRHPSPAVRYLTIQHRSRFTRPGLTDPAKIELIGPLLAISPERNPVSIAARIA